jgi:phage-related protein (TIGR01555 family)
MGKYFMTKNLKSKKPKVTETRFTDGYTNFAAQLGVNRETKNILSAGDYDFNYVTRDRLKLERMYRGSWIVGAAIDSYAEDMVREGITIKSDSDPLREQEILSSFNRMGIWQELQNAIKWGRLYGGALAVIDIDGQDPSSPLDVSRVGKDQFKGLLVFNRWQLNTDIQLLIETGKEAGLPAFYTVLADMSNGRRASITYHHSRVIRFIGIKLPHFQAITEQLWGESVIERIYDRILPYDTVTFGTANLIQKAHLQTVSVNGMREVLAAGGVAEENLLKSFMTMGMMQSAVGMSLIDSLDTLTTHSYSFAGISDVMWQFGQQIAASLDSTMVRLFGQSPSGFSSGESDLRMYYDKVRAKQESCGLSEGILKVLRVLHMSKFGEEAPKGMDFEFVPLWQTEAKEKAQISELIAVNIAMLYEKGIISHETALKELKQSSNETGIYTNIDEKDIQESQITEPPAYSPRESVTPEPPQQRIPEARAPRVSLGNRIKEFFGG